MFILLIFSSEYFIWQLSFFLFNLLGSSPISNSSMLQAVILSSARAVIVDVDTFDSSIYQCVIRWLLVMVTCTAVTLVATGQTLPSSNSSELRWVVLPWRLIKKVKKGKQSIAIRKKPHRYGNSRAIWDHTVLPATGQRWYSRLHPSRSWYSVKRPRRDARLSWPSWPVTARDGIPARRQSPIPVVTGPNVH